MGRNNFYPFVLLFIFDNVIASYSFFTKCNNVESKSTMLQLKRHLLCQYDSNVRPVQNNNNKTNVKLHITPQFLEYNNENEIFELHTWIALSWEDSHLTWDSTQFDNIQYMFASVYEIWVPDISLHDIQMEENISPSFTMAKCWVSKTGTVNWITPVKYSTYCVADNTWWPYNTMNCTIQFGSWSHSSDEIKLAIYQNLTYQADLHNYQKNVEWDLLKVYVTKRKEDHKYTSDSIAELFSYHFILKRHWGIIRIVYITPTILLMMMTLTALWLEPKSFERMVIANFNFVCHILCIKDVNWEMPKSSFNIPKLLIFYETSFALASFTLILTNILRQLQGLTTEPPRWISTITTSILRSRVGKILLVSILDPAVTAKIEVDADDNTDLVHTSNKRSSWEYVTIFLGWLAFLSVLLVYIVLLSTCLPV